ncbi:ankyrin repeat ph and sec7 domain containing protein secg-related [Anaeramoeba ignava]|uniref:Ankyrin repeat ph and sec7 domain containing protein secg-related n=1 Tax=Anaeramoeba ignava TaxID=1746090 RepID=A0A9Q0REY0_ANAIG|nr:ankyrin repeat ph and sec7 domain containing protein secg-related [Anaeramoeba ignava]
MNQIVDLIKLNDLANLRKITNKNFFLKTNKNKQTFLHQALIFKSQKETIQFLLEKGINVNSKDVAQLTPLHVACQENCGIEIITILLDNKADVNATEKWKKRTPLHLACMNGSDSKIITELVNRGANIEAADFDNQSAIHYALLTANNPKEMIKMLWFDSVKLNTENQALIHLVMMKKQADPKIPKFIIKKQKHLINAQDMHLRTPLHYAMENSEQMEAISALLSSGARIDMTDGSFNTSLIFLLKSGKIRDPKIILSCISKRHINMANKQHMCALHYAILNSYSVEIIEMLLENGAKLDIPGPKNKTPLFFAIEKNQIDTIEFFLSKKGNEINVIESEKGLTPLMFALDMRSPLAVVFSLIDHPDLDLKIKNKFNQSVIHFACLFGSPENVVKILKKIIEKISIQNQDSADQININSVDVDGNTPLHLLCSQAIPSSELVSLLLDGIGVDVNARNNQNQTALHYACANTFADSSTIRALVESGADVAAVNNFKQYPLHLALRTSRDIAVLKSLISKKIDPDLEDSFRQSLIVYALGSENPIDALQLIISIGADVNSCVVNKQSPAHFAVLRKNNDLEILRILDAHKANFLLTNSQGKTPLMVAIMNGARWETVDYLAEVEPKSICLEDTDENTALHLACQFNHKFQIIDSLIKKGSNVKKANREGWTPLHYAVFHDADIAVIDLLLANDADPNMRTKEGYNCIHLCFQAKLYSSPQILETLLKNGAHVNDADSYKNTPLLFACDVGAPTSFVKILLDFGADINIRNKFDQSPLSIVLATTNVSLVKLLLSYDPDTTGFGEQTLGSYFSDLFKSFYSVNQDFLRFFNRKEFSDLSIKCIDGIVPAHSQFLALRLFDNSVDARQKVAQLTTIFSQSKIAEITSFLQFVYSGIFDFSDPLFEQKIGNFLKKIHILPEIWIPKKRGRRGLLADLSALQQDSKSFDFKVIVADTAIEIHKIVLAARSDLFRSMFLCVEDDSNQVHEYSGKSLQAMQLLFSFFYLDEIDPVASFDVISELIESADFFQLNENSSLVWKLKDFLWRIKKPNQEELKKD